MKKKKTVHILFSLALLVIIYSSIQSKASDNPAENNAVSEYPERCTTVLVGKDASVDGSVIACQTADCGMCDFTWQYMPAADHKEGAVRKIYHIHQIKTWPPEEGGKWIKYVDGYTGTDIPHEGERDNGPRCISVFLVD